MAELFVSTYNTLMLIYPKSKMTIRALASLGSKSAHSIMCFQELRNATPGYDIMEDMKKILPDMQCSFFLHENPSRDDLGLGTFTDLNILEEKKINLPKAPKEYYNPQSYLLKEMPQCGALALTLQFGKKMLRIVNLHMDVGGGMKHKFLQLRHTIQNLKGEADYEIITGDFNSLGLVRFSAKKLEKYRLGFLSILGDGFECVPINGKHTSDVKNAASPTLVIPNLLIKMSRFFAVQQRLDWMFVKGFKIKHSEILYEMKGSDHYPFVARLEY